MPSFDETTSVTQRRGKWSDAGVPHRGWTCVGVEDLGEPSLTCQMCESQEIRYVHYMRHPQYRDVLGCGCICAGNMEQDLARAERRDRFMISRAGKRRRWLFRKWRVSAKGNDWIQTDGYRVTVYPRGSRWGVTAAATDDSRLRHDWRTYPTSEAAKLAGFDFVTRLLA